MRIKYVICVVCVLLSLQIHISLAEELPKVQLDEISEAEKETIEQLFVLNAEIEYMGTRISTMNLQIEALNGEIFAQSKAIETFSQKADELKDAMRRILVHKQRSGVGSDLQMLLQSENLKDFMFRLNLLRDLSKQSKSVSENFKKTLITLEDEKLELESLRDKVVAEEKSLQALFEEKEVAKQDLERYLSALAERRSYYESYLTTIEKSWSELKPMFTNTVATFNRIIEKNELPEDTLTVQMGFLSAVATLEEKRFNQALKDYGELPQMVFEFSEKNTRLNIPEYNIVLNGNFELIDAQTIQFTVTSGLFYTFELNPSALADLFNEGALKFNLKALLGKNIIRTIEYKEKQIILNVVIKLF